MLDLYVYKWICLVLHTGNRFLTRHRLARELQAEGGDTDHSLYLLGGHVVHERGAQLAQLQVRAQRAVHAHLHTHTRCSGTLILIQLIVTEYLTVL